MESFDPGKISLANHPASSRIVFNERPSVRWQQKM
jgi:hypothetical protein